MPNLRDMRRILTAAVMSVLLLPGPSSAQPIAVKKQQIAFAFWLVPTGTKGHFVGYYALALLDEPGGGEFAWDVASVGKGRCNRTRTENSVKTSCTYRAGAVGKASESFTMDPLLRTAELRLESKNEKHHVAWTGDQDLTTYGAAEGCMSDEDDEPREGRGGGLARFAKASGRILGDHVVAKGGFSAMMMSGAMVTECTQARALAGLKPGQSLRITL
jgi:hypothetical protein